MMENEELKTKAGGQKTNLTEPKLAEPGDGLSGLEMFVLKKILKNFPMRKPSRHSAIKKLKAGQQALEASLSQFKGVDLTKRVLVPRPWFVEDSSRFWSAAMLFRHVGKVNGAVAKAIEMKFSLAEESPEGAKQRLRAVKPEAELNTISEIEKFRSSMERLEKAASSVHENDTNTIPHPWLKQLTYLQWTWFAGFHMQVHAKQLDSIYRELSTKSS
jgi:hypothetical protein